MVIGQLIYIQMILFILLVGGNSPVLNHSGRSTNDVITSKEQIYELE
jgi:hypothetical protein